MGKRNFFKVREKSVNFVFGQGNLEFCSKSGKSQENLYHFEYVKVFLTFIGRLNNKTEKYVNHVMFSYKLRCLKSVKFALDPGKVKE